MGLGWAPDLRRGGISPLPVIREKLGLIPLRTLPPSSKFCEVEIRKVFSEIRLPFPLFPHPHIASVERGSQEAAEPEKQYIQWPSIVVFWGLSAPLPPPTSIICPKGGKRTCPEYSPDQPLLMTFLLCTFLLLVISWEGKPRQRDLDIQ